MLCRNKQKNESLASFKTFFLGIPSRALLLQPQGTFDHYKVTTIKKQAPTLKLNKNNVTINYIKNGRTNVTEISTCFTRINGQ